MSMHSHGVSGRHFAMNHNVHSNRGGLRRGQERAAYVHRLNSERRGTREAGARAGTTSTTASTGTRGTTAASTGTTGGTTATTGTGTGTTGGGSGGERR